MWLNISLFSARTAWSQQVTAKAAQVEHVMTITMLHQAWFQMGIMAVKTWVPLVETSALPPAPGVDVIAQLHGYQWDSMSPSTSIHKCWNFIFWLVVGPPLWKIWKSIGMISNPIYGKIKNGNQTTNQSSLDLLRSAGLPCHFADRAVIALASVRTDVPTWTPWHSGNIGRTESARRPGINWSLIP